jgi:hypothetical protein
MGYSHSHHRHGKVSLGRIMVAVAFLLVLAANLLLYKQAASPASPSPILQLIVIISLLWMFAGAAGMCVRRAWGRVLILTILNAGAFGFFILGMIALTSKDSGFGGLIRFIFIAVAIYAIASLVLTNSRHVRRLTSRALE